LLKDFLVQITTESNEDNAAATLFSRYQPELSKEVALLIQE